MNKTTAQNFFEIMEIAQKYHNTNMAGQGIDEQTTDADALRVIQLCAEIRRDNGEIGARYCADARQARYDLTESIVEATKTALAEGWVDVDIVATLDANAEVIDECIYDATGVKL